jgi:hypothetical protein
VFGVLFDEGRKDVVSAAARALEARGSARAAMAAPEGDGADELLFDASFDVSEPAREPAQAAGSRPSRNARSADEPRVVRHAERAAARAAPQPRARTTTRRGRYGSGCPMGCCGWPRCSGLCWRACMPSCCLPCALACRARGGGSRRSRS